jgi:hypothetical protein
MTPFEGTLGEVIQSLTAVTRRAVREYATLVDAIVREQATDIRHIERMLDGLLDFAFDTQALRLYKRLCRHYYGIDPAGAAYYVDAYRDLWDSQPKEQS